MAHQLSGHYERCRRIAAGEMETKEAEKAEAADFGRIVPWD